jgi:hypothetical protein
MASWPMVDVHGARKLEKCSSLTAICQQRQRHKGTAGRTDRLDHTELGRNHSGSIDRETAYDDSNTA